MQGTNDGSPYEWRDHIEHHKGVFRVKCSSVDMLEGHDDSLNQWTSCWLGTRCVRGAQAKHKRSGVRESRGRHVNDITHSPTRFSLRSHRSFMLRTALFSN